MAATTSDRLIAILAEGSSQDGRIALFLKRHPTKAALPAIDAALERAPDKTNAKWLRDARAACAGTTGPKNRDRE